MISIHTVANCNKRKSSGFRSWKSNFTISDPFSLARYISVIFLENKWVQNPVYIGGEREREETRTVPGHCSCVERPCFAAKKEIERRFLCAKCSLVRACVRLRRKFGCAKTMMAEGRSCKNCTRQGRLRIPSLPIPVPPPPYPGGIDDKSRSTCVAETTEHYPP